MITSNVKQIKKVIVITFILNLLVSGIKVVLGLTSNSASIYADGLHSISDAFNNVVGLIAISIAYRPADENHPYGHKKYETILSLFIGFILISIAFNLIKSNITNFNSGVDLNIELLQIIIMMFTLVINIIITKYQIHMGNKYNSSFLVSDAKHTLSDIFVTISVIVSLIGIKFFNLPDYFDNIMSIFVAIIIAKAGVDIILEASKVLTDSMIFDPNEIEKIVLSFSEVKETHFIKSRGFEDDGFIELHILVDPLMNVKKAHQLNHDIEEKIRNKFKTNVSIIIHIEPDEDKYRIRGDNNVN